MDKTALQDTIIKKKSDRFRFLLKLYEETNGAKHAMVPMFELGSELGLSRDETENIVDYLIGEGLAKHRALGGILGIEHQGVIEIEKALSAPEKETQYFPPVNILNVQNMVNSQIQQGAHASTQTQSLISSQGVEQLEAFLAEFRRHFDNLPLGADDKKSASADMQTLYAQIESGKPKVAIVKESLRSIRSILEGVTANVVASDLLARMSAVAQSIGI